MTQFARGTSIWRRMERNRRAEEIKAIRGFEYSLNAQIERAISGDVTTSELRVNDLFIRNAMEKVWQSTVRRFAFLSDFQIDKKGPSGVEGQVRNFLENNLIERINNITEGTRDTLRKILADLMAEGVGIPNMAREIVKRTGEINKVRATRIARTEVIGASNYGSLLGVQQAGIAVKKVWISTRDVRTRDAHLAADGQAVNLDQDFTVNGEQLSFPGDPKGSTGNVINCRCAIGYERIDKDV